MNIAIVEDYPRDQRLLYSYIERFFQENQPEKNYTVDCYDNAVLFLEQMSGKYNIVFLDIQMPLLNGMEAAAIIRKKDPAIQIIFVTNMAQFAVKGYDVQAIGFVLKPVRYQDFFLSMDRAVQVSERKEGIQFLVTNKDETVRVSTDNLLYAEVQGHMLHFHTTDRSFSGSGSLSELEKRLSCAHFLRCNNCYLINPGYIHSVQGFQVTMQNGEILQISHPRKKKFMQSNIKCSIE